MKKYIILALSLVGVLATSCLSDDEFLKEQVKDKVTVANAFNTSEQVINTVFAGYYDYSAIYFKSSSGGLDNFARKMAGTDICDGKFDSSSSRLSDIPTTWSSTSTTPKTFWEMFYKMISYSNLALSQVDNVEWADASKKSRTIAEAKFLRGLSYLRLGELFGGVPLVLEYSEVPRFDYERETRVKTYDAAITDLKAAYDGLPEKIVSPDHGRASKYAAALYLAEAYLARGVADNDNKSDFTSAENYAKEVTDNHPLMTQRFGVRNIGATGSNYGVANEFKEGNVYSDLFVSPNIELPENTEAIWVFEAAPGYQAYESNGGRRNTSYGLVPSNKSRNWNKTYDESKKGSGVGPWVKVSAKYGSRTYPAEIGGCGWGEYTPTWWASYEMWDSDYNGNKPESAHDLRFVEDVTATCRYICLDDTHSMYEQKVGWDETDHNADKKASTWGPIFYKETCFSKWDYDEAQPSVKDGFFVYDYRNKYAARSAEAWLLLAEARLRGGNAAGALEALNTVRARAEARAFTAIDMDVVLDERARELLFEDFRWATFLRMKPEEWKHRIYDHGTYSARGDVKMFPEIKRWPVFKGEIEWNLWPIPQTYIDINNQSDGMPQNEGFR